MNIKHRQTCRICGNPNLTSVINLGYQFFQGAFSKNNDILTPTRKSPNEVVRCDTNLYENACGLIQTKHSIPPEILYSNYWYQSGISDSMKKHLASIVKNALSIIDKNSGTVLDIASNDNTLLRNYPPTFKKVGVDPSDIASKQKDKDIKVINTTFPTEELNGEFFDIVTSIACYYDVESPKDFALKIKQILKNEGIWIFEVAYWPSMLNNLAYDSIVNEHIIHYHLAPLEILFKKIGLKIFKAEKTDTNGGSILCYVTHSECKTYDTQESNRQLQILRMEEFNMALDENQTYINFRYEVAKHRSDLKVLIKKIRDEGKTIHIYGASTKLNTILGYCDIGPELIPFASERSPEKWGGKTLNGIELISEEESRNKNPDYYLVGPYHFKNEILSRENKMIKKGTKFIFPLPKIEIYD